MSSAQLLTGMPSLFQSLAECPKRGCFCALQALMLHLSYSRYCWVEPEERRGNGDTREKNWLEACWCQDQSAVLRDAAQGVSAEIRGKHHFLTCLGVLALLLAAQSKTSPFNPSGLDLKSCFSLMRGSMDEEERLEFSWECRDEQPWWEPGGRNSASPGSLPLPAWWCSPQQQLEATAEILEPPGLP